MVDGQQYKPKITEPSCTEILEMKPNELRQALSMRLNKGDEITKNGSIFFGFSAKVHSLQEVVMGYKQLRYRFLDATHVMCGYKIMDQDVAHMQDCVDGGELGAGRKLLKVINDEGYENVAVYVVRFHRGPNLGPVRFDMISTAAKSALEKLPTDINQLIGAQPGNNFSLFRSFPKAATGRGARLNTQQTHSTGVYPAALLPTNLHRSRGATAAARALFSDRNREGAVNRAPITSVEV